MEVQSSNLQQSTSAGSVLDTQGMNQPSPMGLGRVRRKSGCFSAGLGSSSAPSGEGKSGCGGLGVISVLEGTQGGFLV